jgi:YXWGXW repeat-containing protein
MIRKMLLVTLSALSFGAIAIPAVASADVGIYLNVAPPPLRVEHVPQPRAGYVWIAGYWDVRGSHHVWRGGHWEHERHGYNYRQPEWVQHENRWELRRGGWEHRDDDHDGVRNGRDHAPENPYRH